MSERDSSLEIKKRVNQMLEDDPGLDDVLSEVRKHLREKLIGAISKGGPYDL